MMPKLTTKPSVFWPSSTALPAISLPASAATLESLLWISWVDARLMRCSKSFIHAGMAALICWK